jgi:cytochrome oxidase Cu insertion factor (SCO1/SenC/PrrC family)
MRRVVVALFVMLIGVGPVLAGEVSPTDTERSWGRTAEYDYDPPKPGTYSLPPIKAAGDGDVLSANGKPAHLRDLIRGRVTILSFIYTRCSDPHACPMATGALYDLHQVSKEDPALAKNLRLVTFSFDPDHDTPAVMASYGGFIPDGGGGSEWLFLTTRDREELQPILQAYGQRVDPKRNPLDPLGPFYHVVRVYLIDREGMIRNIYSYGMLDPRMVLADVRTLMMEPSPAGK